MNKVIIQCPNCENEMVVPSDSIGKQIACPTCREEFWAKKSLIVHKGKEGFDKFIRYAAYIGGSIIVFLFFVVRGCRSVM